MSSWPFGSNRAQHDGHARGFLSLDRDYSELPMSTLEFPPFRDFVAVKPWIPSPNLSNRRALWQFGSRFAPPAPANAGRLFALFHCDPSCRVVCHCHAVTKLASWLKVMGLGKGGEDWARGWGCGKPHRRCGCGMGWRRKASGRGHQDGVTTGGMVGNGPCGIQHDIFIPYLKNHDGSGNFRPQFPCP